MKLRTLFWIVTSWLVYITELFFYTLQFEWSPPFFACVFSGVVAGVITIIELHLAKKRT